MSLGMKIMISQPMKGKTNKQIAEERKNVIKMLENKSYEVIDTIISENAPKDIDEARGCKIEHQVAVEYGNK